MGIYLTQVTTTCSFSGCGRLSARPAGIGGALFDRGVLPGVSVSTSLARWILQPALWRPEGVTSVGSALGVRCLSSSGIGDCWNGFSRQPIAADLVVPSGVVGDQSEERCQRHGIAARAGLEELQDGLDLAAQTSPRDGATWAGSAARRVEVDEAFVGGEEEGVHGWQTETKAMIAVAAEEDGPGIGRIRMRRILDASADSLGVLYRGFR